MLQIKNKRAREEHIDDEYVDDLAEEEEDNEAEDAFDVCPDEEMFDSMEEERRHVENLCNIDLTAAPAPPTPPTRALPEEHSYRGFDETPGVLSALGKLPSLDLAAANDRLKKDAESHMTSLISCGSFWKKLGDSTGNGTYGVGKSDRDKFERDLVRRMNCWMVELCTQGKETGIAVRFITKGGNYGVLVKSPRAMGEIFARFRVAAFNEEVEFARDHHQYSTGPSNRIKAKGLRWDSKAQEYKKPDSQLDFVNLFEIWRRHPDHATASTLGFIPKPKYLIDLQHPLMHDQLNSWAGFAPGFTREEVATYKDWESLRWFFNHLNFTWCDREEDFVYLLKKWAQKMQMPWLKQSVSEGVGGRQGVGKTAVFLLLGKIIG